MSTWLDGMPANLFYSPNVLRLLFWKVDLFHTWLAKRPTFGLEPTFYSFNWIIHYADLRLGGAPSDTPYSADMADLYDK